MDHLPPAELAQIGNRESEIVVVLDNVRSLYNVGAVMRACDGAGATRLLTCGITPHPSLGAVDPRRGPVTARAERELRKTALGAFERVRVEHHETLTQAVAALRQEGAIIVAVEATPDAVTLWESPALDHEQIGLLLGHEVDGLGDEALALADALVRVPMLGAGKSLNVAVAAAVVLYEVIRRRA